MLFYDYYSACDCDGNHHGGDERLIDFSANMCFLCSRKLMHQEEFNHGGEILLLVYVW